MALTLAQTFTAVAANCPSSFQGVGGVAPYSYSVMSNGAGGTIDSSTGVYKGPQVASSDPKFSYDIIKVTDANASTATARILVGTPLILFCDILKTELNLSQDHVYLWDQKLMQPTDSSLYVAVSVPSPRPFANSTTQSSDGDTVSQSVNMYAAVDIDILSRGPAARDRKEEVILALNSIYSQQQQTANSFFIGSLSSGFVNLNELDGAAIPYRYRITVGMQYAVTKVKPVPYYDSNFTPTVDTNA